jgi:hypothetical protein
MADRGSDEHWKVLASKLKYLLSGRRVAMLLLKINPINKEENSYAG